jgi:hypothetical protein
MDINEFRKYSFILNIICAALNIILLLTHFYLLLPTLILFQIFYVSFPSLLEKYSKIDYEASFFPMFNNVIKIFIVLNILEFIRYVLWT